jgi:hypothetical protein
VIPEGNPRRSPAAIHEILCGHAFVVSQLMPVRFKSNKEPPLSLSADPLWEHFPFLSKQGIQSSLSFTSLIDVTVAEIRIMTNQYYDYDYNYLPGGFGLPEI